MPKCVMRTIRASANACTSSFSAHGLIVHPVPAREASAGRDGAILGDDSDAPHHGVTATGRHKWMHGMMKRNYGKKHRGRQCAAHAYRHLRKFV